LVFVQQPLVVKSYPSTLSRLYETWSMPNTTGVSRLVLF